MRCWSTGFPTVLVNRILDRCDAGQQAFKQVCRWSTTVDLQGLQPAYKRHSPHKDVLWPQVAMNSPAPQAGLQLAQRCLASPLQRIAVAVKFFHLWHRGRQARVLSSASAHTCCFPLDTLPDSLTDTLLDTLLDTFLDILPDTTCPDPLPDTSPGSVPPCTSKVHHSQVPVQQPHGVPV